MHRRNITKYCSRTGFTLTELLVLLAILGLVFGLLIPLWNVDREKQRRVVCAFHLKQIGIALAAYASDHGGHLPTANDNQVEGNRASWDRALAPAYVAMNNLTCPSDRALRDQVARSYTIFYGSDCNSGRRFIQGSRLPCQWLADPANIVVLAERAKGDNWIGRIGGGAGYFCRMDQIASLHVKGKPLAGNYLFLDGHVTWEESPGTNLFPRAPDEKKSGPIPCP